MSTPPTGTLRVGRILPTATKLEPPVTVLEPSICISGHFVTLASLHELSAIYSGPEMAFILGISMQELVDVLLILAENAE